MPDCFSVALQINRLRRALCGTMSWQSITAEELTALINSELIEFNQQMLSLFESIRVPLESVDIDRNGNIESVYVVAKFDGKILFYEDVEEGFEITTINENSVITEYGFNQFELKHVINQLLHSRDT